jgi:hypothetical protein
MYVPKFKRKILNESIWLAHHNLFKNTLGTPQIKENSQFPFSNKRS